MSKPTIPICKLPDEECNLLFKSVIDKLKIENPTFFCPIYKKLVSNENATPEDLQNFVLDSKYKCKEILEKLIDSDDDEVFDSDYEEQEQEQEDDELINPAHAKSDGENRECEDEIETLSDSLSDSLSLSSQDEFSNLNSLDDDIKDIPIEDNYNSNEDDEDDEEEFNNYSTYDDKEIEEAINNTYMAMAMIEKVNKVSGKKSCKEEMIHVKKTALLDPLKVMKDEFVIPSKIKNKNLDDEVMKNTMTKLNSYNNCGHVESLFLYLGNKLVETGKCPSFPYYYGCINGEDPNYHHNITDEYESVARTKWFKDRVKTDFDLLIIEDEDDLEQDLDNPAHKAAFKKSRTKSDEENDDNSDDEITECNDLTTSELPEISDIVEKTFKPLDTNSSGIVDISFIKDMDDEDLDLVFDDNTNTNEITNVDKCCVSSNTNKYCEDDKCCEDNKCCEDKCDNTICIDDKCCDEKCNNTICIDDKCCEYAKCDESNKDLVSNAYSKSNSKKCSDDCKKDCICIDSECKGNIEGNIEGNSKDECNSETDSKCDSECDSDSDLDLDSDSDFIEELSDVDKDNLSMTDFEDHPGNMYYIKCESMPVSLSLMEKLDDTLDNILDDDYNMSETEWFGMFFQVAFGLAVAQKYFNFVHNDLHSSNVMFKKTSLKYLYFQVNTNYYKIPTYGKITKIIDFARGTFKFGDRWIFSDQFKEDGDAHGQYDYPVDGSLKNCEHKPNPSFDLVRLGTTVIHRLENVPKVREFVEEMTLDDYDNSVCYDEDTFDLYIDIARNCHKAIPLEIMGRKEFEKFKINKTKIPKGQYVFKY